MQKSRCIGALKDSLGGAFKQIDGFCLLAVPYKLKYTTK